MKRILTGGHRLIGPTDESHPHRGPSVDRSHRWIASLHKGPSVDRSPDRPRVTL